VTLEDVREELVAVRKLAKDDDESAHSHLDSLYIRVLRAIATGQCRDAPPEDFAEAVLAGEDIEFARWYA
jgi:hypothetical protein